MPIAIAAGVGAAGSVLGGVIGGGASKSAASTQAAAAQQAAQLQYSMYQQTAQRLQPWVTTGTAAQNELGGLLGLSGYQASGAGGFGTGALTQPFPGQAPTWNPTLQGLQATPGYQFTMQQGLQAAQNAATAQGQGGGVMPGGGLGASGPEAKGMTQYAENLASTTYGQQFGIYEQQFQNYNQQFQNYWNQLNNVYNMVSGASNTGASAAAGVGQAGQQTAASAGNLLTSGAAAQAAGTVGAANALGGSLSGIGNIAQNYATLNAIQQMGQSPISTGVNSASLWQGNTLPQQ
jgi:hypothetical protein